MLQTLITEAHPTHASNCATFETLQFLLVFLQHDVLCAVLLHISMPPNGLAQMVPNAAQARIPGLLYVSLPFPVPSSVLLGANKKGQ